MSQSDSANEQSKRFENLKQKLEGPELQQDITKNLNKLKAKIAFTFSTILFLTNSSALT